MEIVSVVWIDGQPVCVLADNSLVTFDPDVLELLR